jgi:hypothetical protein
MMDCIQLSPSNLSPQAVFFTKRIIRELPKSDLFLDGYSIPWIDRAKYLSLILDKKLTFSPHFDYVSSDRVQKLTRILYLLINRRSTLSLNQKVLFFIRQFFSLPVWRECAATATYKRRLQILQNMCLMLILNVPRLYGTSETHERTKCKLISENIETHYEKFCHRLVIIRMKVKISDISFRLVC